MPAKIFARIRLRRGLFSDLPNPLMGSEIGHCIDEQRVFIGSGSISDGAPTVGNTEILTQYSPNTSLIEYTYISNTGLVAQTGQSPSVPTVRTLQQTLDDRVSIKAFGAFGDGIHDDSAAFNLAVQQLYTQAPPAGVQPQALRRQLYFPAGVYRIIANELVFPPNMWLVGEGKNSSQILLDLNSSLTELFRTCDSLGQTGTAIGTNGATLPTNIVLEDISLVRGSYGLLGRLERVSNIYFKNCYFSSAWVPSSSSTGKLFNVSVLGSVLTMSNFTFDTCEFANYYDVFDLSGCPGFSQLLITNSSLHDSFRGLYLTNSLTDAKVVSTEFTNLQDRGIYVDSGSQVRSIYNTFNTVGVTNAVNPIEYTAGTVTCSSMGDEFISCIANASCVNNSTHPLTMNTTGTGNFQNVTYSARQTGIVLADNTALATNTGISFPLAAATSIFMDYTLIRGSDYRIGRILIATDGSSSAYLYDDGFENATSGTTFSVSISGSTVAIQYTTTSTGNSATFFYSYRYYNYS